MSLALLGTVVKSVKDTSLCLVFIYILNVSKNIPVWVLKTIWFGNGSKIKNCGGSSKTTIYCNDLKEQPQFDGGMKIKNYLFLSFINTMLYSFIRLNTMMMRVLEKI